MCFCIIAGHDDRIASRTAAGARGSWRGTSTLQDPGKLEPQSSPSALTVTPLIGRRFVRLDYTWGYEPTDGTRDDLAVDARYALAGEPAPRA